LSADHLLNYFGDDCNVLDITPFEIEKYKKSRIEGGKKIKSGTGDNIKFRREDLRPATINRDIQFLRNVFNRLIEWGNVESNPVQKVKMLKEDNVTDKVLTLDEIKTFLDKCKNIPYLHLAVNIAAHTGMRASEVLNLHIPDDSITIEEYSRLSMRKGHKVNFIDLTTDEFILNDVKTSNPRKVPMLPDIKNEILQYIKSAHRAAGGRLFEVKEMRKTMEATRKAAKINKKVSWISFRQSFMTECGRLGYPRELIQSFVGQVSESVFSRYFHPTEKAKKEVAQKIASVMRHKENKK